MATEIERKFLVHGDGWKSGAGPATHIQQGYFLAREDKQLRVRIAQGEDGAHALIALKTSSHDVRVREEHEAAIPLAIGKALLALSRYRVAKTRYRVPSGGRTWEVDVYQGFLRGLVTAEVELERADAEVAIPGWAGEEVTGEALYSNARLAHQGTVPALKQASRHLAP